VRQQIQNQPPEGNRTTFPWLAALIIGLLLVGAVAMVVAPLVVFVASRLT
jgi:hypothetical protein